MQVGLASEEDSSNETYRPLLARLPAGQVTLEDAYAAMHNIMKEVIDYTDVSSCLLSLTSADRRFGADV